MTFIYVYVSRSTTKMYRIRQLVIWFNDALIDKLSFPWINNIKILYFKHLLIFRIKIILCSHGFIPGSSSIVNCFYNKKRLRKYGITRVQKAVVKEIIKRSWNRLQNAFVDHLQDMLLNPNIIFLWSSLTNCIRFNASCLISTKGLYGNIRYWLLCRNLRHPLT